MPIHHFAPPPDILLTIDAKVAQEAVRAWWADPANKERERSLRELSGLETWRGLAGDWLHRISFLHRTTNPRADIDIIGAALGEVWDRWSGLIGGLAPLCEAVPPRETTRELLQPFLAQNTRHRPRTFATRVLHIAAPLSYMPAGERPVTRLALELEAGYWGDASHLQLDGFAAWYSDYLAVVREIGGRNRETVAALLELDCSLDDLSEPNHGRGLPKLVVRLLRGCDALAGRGEPVTLFHQMREVPPETP